MFDVDTFMTIVYVEADDFCKKYVVEKVKPGSKPSLSPSETITLMILRQALPFRSQREFYRYAKKSLIEAFPTLPHRSQYNRLVNHTATVLLKFWQYQLRDMLSSYRSIYEVVDTFPLPVRNIKRRGRGWLAGMTQIGWSTRLGWFNGFRVLISANNNGIITGYGFSPGNTKDQPMAETFFAARRFPQPDLPQIGIRSSRYYLLDTGFEGRKNHQRWRQVYGAEIICKPDPRRPDAWNQAKRRWFSGIRQIIETVIDKLLNWLQLDRVRAHSLKGFYAQLAAKVTAYNFLVHLNLLYERPVLQFSDLLSF